MHLSRKHLSVVVNFSHYRLLWNLWTESNETWPEARPRRPLPSLCFFGLSEKQDGCPYLWLVDAFRLLLWNRWIKFNETWQEARSQRPLLNLWVFFGGGGDRKNKMATLASDWLRHFRLLVWNHWTEFNETWQDTRSQRPVPSLCFFGPIGITRWPPWPLIGRDIFDLSSETA